MSSAVLQVLFRQAPWAYVDAWSDYRDELPPQVRQAQDKLRHLQTERDGVDTGMGIDIDRTDATQEKLLRTYAAWSIHVELLPAAGQQSLAVLHDGASFITAELSDAQVYWLRRQLEGTATVRLLEQVHAEAKAEADAVRRLVRRQRWTRRWQRWLPGVTRVGGTQSAEAEPRSPGTAASGGAGVEQPAPVDGELLAELARRDQLETTVVLNDGRRLRVFDIAEGYDMGDEWAHVTTNASPGRPGAPLDFFFTSEVLELVDPSTGRRLYP